MSEAPATQASRTFRMLAAGRWLPRVAGAAGLAAALLSGLSLEPRVPGVLGFRLLLALAAGLAALWLVRSGAEVHRDVRLATGRLEWLSGGRVVEALALDEVAELDWEPPLAAWRRWLPALALRDRHGRTWRVPAFLASGGAFVDALVAESGREELASWSRARGLARRMAGVGPRVALGYGTALGLVAAAASLHLS